LKVFCDLEIRLIKEGWNGELGDVVWLRIKGSVPNA